MAMATRWRMPPENWCGQAGRRRGVPALKALLHSYNRELGLGNTNRGRYSNPRVDQLTEQAIVTIDDKKREQLLQEATEIAIGDLGIIPIHYEVSTWGMQKNLGYKARTDQYALAMDIRPR